MHQGYEADRCGGGGEDGVEWDETGDLEVSRSSWIALLRRLFPHLFAEDRPQNACTTRSLNGSWLLEIRPNADTPRVAIRGPLRIEVGNNRVRASGDLYVRRSERPDERPLTIKDNAYPAFPREEYRWYFRSTSVSYVNGELNIRFVRHLWDTAAEEFAGTDSGFMRFRCSKSPFSVPLLPKPTLRMEGELVVGGERHKVTATKTSRFYRGCLVEVDVMKNRSWPSEARSCDDLVRHTFTEIYRAAGLDFVARVDDTNVPQDAQLTRAELHALLAAKRNQSPGRDAWHLWLLVGSKMNGTLGLMFDTGNAPHREGAVGFFDPKLPSSTRIEASVRGKKLGEVELAFLRTLVHEAGHAFNLYHPKHDVHGVAKGTTIMNQTGDVMGFATASNPFPCNSTMSFNDHNRSSLIHSPDPQVKPGWKEFGWGHGPISSGLPEPADALGLDDGSNPDPDLRLDLDVPEQATLGDFVSVGVTLSNQGKGPREVTTALNLSEGDLQLNVQYPDGTRHDARDVVIACGDRRTQVLEPGEEITGRVQIFYTSLGHTFARSGSYCLSAKLDLGYLDGTYAQSDAVQIEILPPHDDRSRAQARSTLDADVGLSLALGDFGADPNVQKKVSGIADEFADQEIGRACAMVVSNSLDRTFHAPDSRRVLRQANKKGALDAFQAAIRGVGPEQVVRLASSVVAARDLAAPLVDRVRDALSRSKAAKSAVQEAEKLMADHFS